MGRWDITDTNNMKKQAAFMSLAIVVIASLCFGFVSCNNQPTPQKEGKNLPELAIGLYGLTPQEATTLLNENGYTISVSGSNQFNFSKEDIEGAIIFNNEGKVFRVGIDTGYLKNVSELFIEWINSVENLGFVNVMNTQVTFTDESKANYKNLSELKKALKGKTDAELTHIEFIVFNNEGLDMGCMCDQDDNGRFWSIVQVG